MLGGSVISCHGIIVMHPTNWLDEINFNDQGLIPVIAQDATSGRNLMVAWMNKAALEETVHHGFAVYWSRSRQQLWRKGETSGYRQRIKEIRLDCDGDVLLLCVEQLGGIACHTGRQSCFYRLLIEAKWQVVDQVLKSPQEIYAK